MDLKTSGMLRQTFGLGMQASVSLPYPGFFSPFPHGTGALSVPPVGLGFEGGPPMFNPPWGRGLLAVGSGKLCAGSCHRTFTFFGEGFHPLAGVRKAPEPQPGPVSLAATSGVSVDFLSRATGMVPLARVHGGEPPQGFPGRKSTDLRELLPVAFRLGARPHVWGA